MIITGGIPTAKGLSALYAHSELEQLVLDYEETDSDEEGIDLTRFPNLKYVLSRSNLNIRNYNPEQQTGIPIKVLNYYQAGKPVKVEYPETYDLYEAAGGKLSDILFPAEKEFTERHFGEQFSEQIDRLAIIPMCMPTVTLKERRYISWKKRYADIRLIIPYGEFSRSSQTERIALCKKNIQDAVEYVRKKDKTFAANRFLDAVWAAFSAVFPE